MKVIRLSIVNFRGIKESVLYFQGHTVLVGDNNIGKSSVLEALDLLFGPERLSSFPVINEHDFYAGEYIGKEGEIIQIEIEGIIGDLSEDQILRFSSNLEWWNKVEKRLLDGAPVEATDDENVKPVLRIRFVGKYDPEEDDFFAQTYFCSPVTEDGREPEKFTKSDKRECGFLYLRTMRTGARALSLEHGSLLDIILRLKEVRPKMWEDVLGQVREVSVASAPELGVSDVLMSVQEALEKLVPSEWGEKPTLKVSDLTREHLRKILTVFISSGISDSQDNEYSTPFKCLGTGSINTLVLSLLSIIAELKKNVIFAMEEPEIAIPPYTQKRIVDSVISKSAQGIFTSHSPYVIEEFNPDNILVLQRETGKLIGIPAGLPPSTKQKKFREELRIRFAEAILARRVLIVEGRTEYDSFIAIARKLSAMYDEEYSSFDNLGIAVINAESDSFIAPLADYYKRLGKKVFAIFDKQTPDDLVRITSVVDHPYEAKEKGFENILMNNISEDVLCKYANMLFEEGLWPSDIKRSFPVKQEHIKEVIDELKEILGRKKGDGYAAMLLLLCEEKEIPEYIKSVLKSIKNEVEKNHPDETCV